MNAILADCTPRFALTDTWTRDLLEPLIAASPALRALTWHTIDLAALDAAAPAGVPAPPPTPSLADMPAFLQYTSGSTAAPRGVRLTHANLLHNSRVIHEAFGHGPDSRGLIWLPPYHDMGLIGGILQPLYGGFPVTLMSPLAFVQRPLRWLRAVSETRATTSGGPCFAFELCLQQIRPEERDTLDLSRWDLAFCGAEPIRADVLDRFAEYFAPTGFRREAFYPCYGLAEATLMVSGGDKDAPPVVRHVSAAALDRNVVAASAPDDTRMVVGCGRPRLDLRVVVVDPERRVRLPDTQVGELWIAGPSVAPGYWHALPADEDPFDGTLIDAPGERFLRSGDLGFRQQGELFLAGRLKDLIIIAGRNHYPQDLERTVEDALPSACRQGVAAFGVAIGGEERLVFWIEMPRGATMDAEAVTRTVRRAVWNAHEVAVHDVCLLPPAHLPRTSSGKLRRFACRRLYLDQAKAPPLESGT
jgi:acyl-CoA synthetase (AMP-forming)/AMP-acid ligase II